MRKGDNGGPAFPVRGFKQRSTAGFEGKVQGQLRHGMSLRDYFAGQALTGLLWADNSATDPEVAPEVARDAYLLADAMIAEKRKREAGGDE